MDFTALSTQRFLCFFLVFLTAFFLYAFFENAERYWLLLTVFVLSSCATSHLFLPRLATILLTGLSILFIVWLITYLGSFFLLLSIFLVFLSGVSVMVAQSYPRGAFAVLSVSLCSIIAGMMPTLALEAVNRVFFILMGMGLVLFFEIIFYLFFLKNKILLLMISALNQLSLLNSDIFSCLVDASYAQNFYLFERRLHFQKNRFVESIEALEQIGKKNYSLSLMIAKLNLLFRIILDYAQLRLRVRDKTLFAVCRDELKAIMLEMTSLFSEVKLVIKHKKKIINTEPLLEKIKRLEESYQHILQITAQEPLVFLLFISSLKAFCAEISHIRVEYDSTI